MAGGSIQIKFNDRELVGLVEQLRGLEEPLDPVLGDIGEYLLLSHAERWDQEEAPDGTPWAPLSPAYAARKADKRPAAGILVFNEFLSLLNYQASGSTLELGTASIYGATHQFGDPDRNIPAREFLGISDEDEGEISGIIENRLKGALSGLS